MARLSIVTVVSTSAELIAPLAEGDSKGVLLVSPPQAGTKSAAQSAMRENRFGSNTGGWCMTRV